MKSRLGKMLLIGIISIRMSVLAYRVNLFAYTTHVDSIRMSVVAYEVKMLLIVHVWHMVALVCSL